MGGSGKQSAYAVVCHSTASHTAAPCEKKTEKKVVSASRHKLAGEKSRGGQRQLVVKSARVAHKRVSYEEQKIQVQVGVSSNMHSGIKVGRAQGNVSITAQIRVESKEKISTTSSSKQTRAKIVDFHGKSSKGPARHETCVMKRNEKQQILQSKGSSNVRLQGGLSIAEKPNPRRTYLRM